MGRSYAELVLSKQYPQNDKFVHKLVYGCNQIGLEALGSGIQRQRAMFWWCFKGGRSKYTESSALDPDDFSGVANALIWAAKVGKGFTDSLVGILFNRGSLNALHLFVDHISQSFDILTKSSNAFDDKTIKFLAQYRQIRIDLLDASQALSSNKDVVAWEKRDDACRTFCEALRADVVPQRFWLPITREILLWEVTDRPEMELERNVDAKVLANPPLVSIEDCSLLMKCIEQLEMSLDRQNLITNFQPKSELAAIRLMLTQALSRSVILTGVHDQSV